MHEFGCLVLRPEIVGMTRQVRIEIRIARSELRLPVIVEMREVIHVLQPFPAGEFVMDQCRIGRENCQIAGLVGSQAEIQIVVDDLVRFIETTQGFEQFAPHQQAGAGHGHDIALR